MINVTVAGRLGKDAELRQAGNSQVCSFSVAGDTGFGDKKQSHWFNCSLWGNQGAALQQYLLKGQQVTVIGEYSEREYEGKAYKELRVNSIELQGGGQSQGQQDNSSRHGQYQQPNERQPQQGFNNQATQQPNNQQPTSMPSGPVDDDIPFNRYFDGEM